MIKLVAKVYINLSATYAYVNFFLTRNCLDRVTHGDGDFAFENAPKIIN